jgi:multidrug efflux pump subunit AcrB
VLRFRLAFLSVVGGGSLLLLGLVLQIPQDPWVSDFNAIMATIKCDPSYSLGRTDAACRPVEEELDRFFREGILKNYYTIVGFRMTADGIFIRRPDVAFFMCTLVDRPEVTSDPEAVVNRLRRAVERRLEEEREHRYLALEVFTPHDGPPLGKPVAVRVESNDYLQAKRVAEEIKAELRRLDGVYGVADNLDLGPREFRFVVDRGRAAAMGFFPADAALALRAANDGIVAGSFKDRRYDEDVAIRVQYAPGDRAAPEDLLLADARGAGPALVPLGEVSRVDVWRPNASYYHYDTRRTVLVTADVDGAIITGPRVNEHLQRVFEDVPLRHPGVRLAYGGEFEETGKSMADQRRSFWIALVFIYVLLAAQFRSYKQPLIVMAVVPFGVLGVLLGLWVRGQPFTIPTFIAMIGLAGVVVNDSLVLVAFINLRRAEGLGRLEAILAAARQRFRPVLLAASTTMGNLLPLAIGLGGISRVWTPFAVSIVFGMGVAALMTLFMVPVLYSLVERK